MKHKGGQMKRREIQDLLNGFAYLEVIGNLYEYIGTVKGKLFFQNVNDDSYISISLEKLLNTDYDIQY